MRDNYKEFDQSKKILITGVAGFIGFSLAKCLLEQDVYVIGFDNMNDYYETSLKNDRLEILETFSSFRFFKGNLADMEEVENVFCHEKPDIVINLAAQAGVRYSISHPREYLESNMVGFFNILECCRIYAIEHLLFASSSSVYGGNEKVPFSPSDNVDEPVSFYAATKKSNELMAHAYSKLYNIPVTGLRFFTVYGPMGRPDMAYYAFSKKLVNGETIQVFNNGDMYRDFTYIDDVVEAIMRIINNPPLVNEKGVQYKIYNIGNSSPEKIMYFVECLEKVYDKKANIEFLPMQQGDVYQTYADISDLEKDFDFRPRTNLYEGMQKFANWFMEYYMINEKYDI